MEIESEEEVPAICKVFTWTGAFFNVSDGVVHE